MKIFIEANNWQDSYNIYIVEEGHNGKRFLAKPMNLEFVEFNNTEPQEPSIKISRVFGRETNFLQALSDALGKAGFSPKTIEENIGELKAAKYHLEDLRKMLKLK